MDPFVEWASQAAYLMSPENPKSYQFTQNQVT
jgi:hypothetical protein